MSEVSVAVSVSTLASRAAASGALAAGVFAELAASTWKRSRMPIQQLSRISTVLLISGFSHQL